MSFFVPRHSVVLLDASHVIVKFLWYWQKCGDSQGNEAKATGIITQMFLKTVLDHVSLALPNGPSRESVVNNKLIVCFDHQGGQRRQICPKYKSGRGGSLEERIPIAKKIIHSRVRPALEGLGVTVYPQSNKEYPPIEADDLMFTAVHALRKQADVQCIVVSQDKDMFQVFRHSPDGIALLRSSYKKTARQWKSTWFLKSEDVLKSKESEGISSHRFAEFQALVGDRSDNISRILRAKPARDLILKSKEGEVCQYLERDDQKVCFEHNLRLTKLMEVPGVVASCSYDTLPFVDLPSARNMMAMKSFYFM